LASRLQDSLANAPPYSKIKLPAYSHIILAGFSLKHPLHIEGRPGTIVEILNGNILIDLREFASKSEKKKNPSE
jgi:hypothetical protein